MYGIIYCCTYHANKNLNRINKFNSGLLNKFIIDPSSGNSIGYLDGIRAIAVVLIVILHSWGLSGQPNVFLRLSFANIDLTPFIRTAFVGVDLFFVLSGFLLSQYWIKADYLNKSRPKIFNYYKRRFLRIAPAYYCVLFLVLLFMIPSYISPAAVFSKEGAINLGAHLIFAQYYSWLSAGSFNVLGILWTISIEMTFYLILPWFAILFLRKRWIITLPVFALVVLAWLWLAKYSLLPLVNFHFNSCIAWNSNYEQSIPLIRHFLAKQFPAHLVDFGLGATLANLVLRKNLSVNCTRLFKALTCKKAGFVYFCLGLIIIISSMYLIATDTTLVFKYYLSQISVALGFTLLIAGIIWGYDILKRFFGFSFFRLIGIVGYSIYLLHMPIIIIINKYPSIQALQPNLRFMAVLATTSIIVLIFSIGLYLFVEKPFILKGKKRL